jgi:hypothetical protein
VTSAPFEAFGLVRVGGAFRLERFRDPHLEAEGADLQHVAVAEQAGLDALAVDARAGSAAAIADPVAVGGLVDETVKGGDFVAVEAEVAAAGPAHGDHVAVDVAGLLFHAAEHRQEGCVIERLRVAFGNHGRHSP